MKKEQAISEAGYVFRSRVGELNALKRRVRELAEATIEREVKERREDAARAIHFAYEMGASKAALRQVTTKDHYDFEAYLALGAKLAKAEGNRSAKDVNSD